MQLAARQDISAIPVAFDAAARKQINELDAYVGLDIGHGCNSARCAHSEHAGEILHPQVCERRRNDVPFLAPDGKLISFQSISLGQS